MCLPATGQMCSNMPSYDMIMNGMIMACWIMLDQEHGGSWHVGDDDEERWHDGMIMKCTRPCSRSCGRRTLSYHLSAPGSWQKPWAAVAGN